MLPLYDENPSRTFPLITLILIGANCFVFFIEIGMPDQAAELIWRYGLIPYDVVHQPIEFYSTVLSSMFLHSGFWHLGGNMLYLWIFGNNIEDVLGKFNFVLFYLVCGSLAAACHIVSDPNSEAPMIGASGAISGVLGAYLMTFPQAKIRTLIFLGFFITLARIPAKFILGFWIVMQAANQLLAGGQASGVAWMAHIGGFIAGMILIGSFRSMNR